MLSRFGSMPKKRLTANLRPQLLDRDLLDHKGLEPTAVSAHEACAQLGLLEA